MWSKNRKGIKIPNGLSIPNKQCKIGKIIRQSLGGITVHFGLNNLQTESVLRRLNMISDNMNI